MGQTVEGAQRLWFEGYDLQGCRVEHQSATYEPGTHDLALAPNTRSRLQSGVYFARLSWPGGSRNHRFVIRR